jgi:hypothetical protein
MASVTLVSNMEGGRSREGSERCMRLPIAKQHFDKISRRKEGTGTDQKTSYPDSTRDFSTGTQTLVLGSNIISSASYVLSRIINHKGRECCCQLSYFMFHTIQSINNCADPSVI